MGTVAALTSDCSAAARSQLVPPNAATVSTNAGDGSPDMTETAPELCVQRSQRPSTSWVDWLSSDCAMSLAALGSSSETSWTCER